jgi:hypothetical protein
MTLHPLEAAYLLALLKPHLDYHRLLAGNTHFTDASRNKLLALEALAAKLANVQAADPQPESQTPTT